MRFKKKQAWTHARLHPINTIKPRKKTVNHPFKQQNWPAEKTQTGQLVISNTIWLLWLLPDYFLYLHLEFNQLQGQLSHYYTKKNHKVELLFNISVVYHDSHEITWGGGTLRFFVCSVVKMKPLNMFSLIEIKLKYSSRVSEEISMSKNNTKKTNQKSLVIISISFHSSIYWYLVFWHWCIW